MSIFSDSMTRFVLKFNFKEAYLYQKGMIQELILENSSVLDKLKTLKQERMHMRSLVDESPEVWEAMVQIIKPTTQITDSQKRISLQTKIGEFLQLKLEAVDLMILESKDPQVYITSGYHQNLFILNLRNGHPSISKK